MMIRLRVLIPVALASALGACDPVASITVRFPVSPGARVTAYWVETYQGRTYPAQQVFSERATGAELSHTAQECCGTAAHYKAGDLQFLACVDVPGAAPTLVCGGVGPEAAPPRRRTEPGTTCEALVASFTHSNVDMQTCALAPAS